MPIEAREASIEPRRLATRTGAGRNDPLLIVLGLRTVIEQYTLGYEEGCCLVLCLCSNHRGHQVRAAYAELQPEYIRHRQI